MMSSLEYSGELGTAPRADAPEMNEKVKVFNHPQETGRQLSGLDADKPDALQDGTLRIFTLGVNRKEHIQL